MMSSLARGTMCDNRGEPLRAPHGRSRSQSRRKANPMSKRARKRRSRKGNKANHGRKPNA